MKRLNLFLSAVLLLLGTAVGAVQKDTLRILAIGNSFSQDAVEQNLHEIAKADGQELIIGNMYIGGCSLERHYGNALADTPDYDYRKVGTDGVRVNQKKFPLSKALADEKWDIVTLQQVSGLSGEKMTYEPYLNEMVNYVRKRAPQAEIWWHQTWAYAKGATHGDFPRYDCDQMKMYRAIMECSSRVCDIYGFGVIPSGTAVQNLRATRDRENCTRDGFHLNHTIGRYLAALTWYEALTGRSVLGNPYKPEALSEERAEMARAAAHAAVKNPYAVTDIGFGEKIEVNNDPAKVAAYTLPDPLRFADGKKVRNAKAWTEKRRPELLGLFENEMYGTAPGRPDALSFQVIEEDTPAFDGLAVRRQVRICYTPKKDRYLTLLLYYPAGRTDAPVFLGLNFRGNESVCDDADILLVDKGQYSRYGIHPRVARGSSASEWEVRKLLSRGYAFATFCADDADPDFEDSRVNGVQANFDRKYTWGNIAEWAWGLSRALDYLEEAGCVDASRVAVTGFSRMGKAALWAGARDERFAMVVSIQSGCGGAALARHNIGETLYAMNTHFPHWYCENYKKYNNNESALPFDQHELLALVAPRPLYVASAAKATWLNPDGEQAAAAAARKVWKLWGSKAPSKLGGHVTDAKHTIIPEDWDRILDFADKNL